MSKARGQLAPPITSYAREDWLCGGGCVDAGRWPSVVLNELGSAKARVRLHGDKGWVHAVRDSSWRHGC